MDVVNETLLISLQQEVKTLNEIVSELPAINDGDEVRSWLFPSKSYGFVNELIYRDDIFELESFKTYLELIIDRLYVGMRLILNFIEEKTAKKQIQNRFIQRPKLITLGFTFQRLWQAVSLILSQEMIRHLNQNRHQKKKTRNIEKITKFVNCYLEPGLPSIPNTNMVNQTTTGDNSSIKACNKEIQTNIIALNKCDSCSSAMLCMKNLLQSFKRNEFKIPFNERQILRPKIFDITQFGCMLQTTTAVEKGVSTLYEKIFSKEQEGEKLHKENLELRSEVIENNGKIAFLHKEIEILKDKRGKDALKISLLYKENEELLQIKSKQEHQIKTLSEVISNLNNSVKVYNEKSFKLACENESLRLLNKRITNNQLDIVKFGTSLQSKLCNIEEEYLSIQNGFGVLVKIAENVNMKVGKIADDLTAVDAKLIKLNEDGDVVSSLQSKLKEIKKLLSKTEFVKDPVKLQKNSFQVKGNPVEDLSRQVEENNEAIKKLEHENVKLKCIISKFNCLKK